MGEDKRILLMAGVVLVVFLGVLSWLAFGGLAHVLDPDPEPTGHAVRQECCGVPDSAVARSQSPS